LNLATEGPIRWQQAKIAAIHPQTHRIRSFVFAPERPFGFRAGQHVDVRLTAPDGYRTERSYSIASAPGDGKTFELAIERLDDGEVSPFFHDVAAVGDEIEFRGPIGGHFVWSVGDGGPILLLGGGSGVVPLLSMVRHRAAERDATPMALIYSARVWDEVICADELIGLAERRDGFDLAFALTREPARRDGDFSRRIDVEMVREILARLSAPPHRAFVCGSNAFVEAAARAAIDAGLAAAIIRTERYGG
jgi:ferredoxin-NADP reductase